MSRMLEELSQEEMQDIVHDLLDKRDKNNNKRWDEIVFEYDLDCSPEVLRKLSVGIEFASNAGMKFCESSMDKNYIERQKLYDVQRKIRQDMREFSRTELICECIEKAIKTLPVVDIPDVRVKKRRYVKRELVVGLGDFHYGAKFVVTGLYGEIINQYNSSVFEQRINELINEISDVVLKEEPEQLTIMITGDMLDGLLRTSQLQRLEYGVVESAIHLAESLTNWLVRLEKRINIPIRLYAVRGNHGEIRPLGSKAGQFPEENMERLVMHYLYARFKDMDWITIATNDAPLTQIVDVCGFQFLLMHGEEYNIESAAKDFINLYNKPIDVFMVGHLHKSQSFVAGVKPDSNIYVERIPSICGVDPYAQSKGYSAAAGATLILVEDGYGFRCIYPIILK